METNHVQADEFDSGRELQAMIEDFRELWHKEPSPRQLQLIVENIATGDIEDPVAWLTKINERQERRLEILRQELGIVTQDKLCTTTTTKIQMFLRQLGIDLKADRTFKDLVSSTINILQNSIDAYASVFKLEIEPTRLQVVASDHKKRMLFGAIGALISVILDFAADLLLCTEYTSTGQQADPLLRDHATVSSITLATEFFDTIWPSLEKDARIYGRFVHGATQFGECPNDNNNKKTNSGSLVDCACGERKTGIWVALVQARGMLHLSLARVCLISKDVDMWSLAIKHVYKYNNSSLTIEMFRVRMAKENIRKALELQC